LFVFIFIVLLLITFLVQQLLRRGSLTGRNPKGIPNVWPPIVRLVSVWLADKDNSSVLIQINYFSFLLPYINRPQRVSFGVHAFCWSPNWLLL